MATESSFPASLPSCFKNNSSSRADCWSSEETAVISQPLRGYPSSSQALLLGADGDKRAVLFYFPGGEVGRGGKRSRIRAGRAQGGRSASYRTSALSLLSPPPDW